MKGVARMLEDAQEAGVCFGRYTDRPNPSNVRSMTPPPPWLWAAFTLSAAGGQTLRNALQHDLVDRVGASNATFVRFLFGFPFSLGFLALACVATGVVPSLPSGAAFIYVIFASTTQVLATALMLLAMRERSFIVATALTKTEAVQIVVFGLVFLGDSASAALLVAVSSGHHRRVRSLLPSRDSSHAPRHEFELAGGSVWSGLGSGLRPVYRSVSKGSFGP